MRGRTIRRASFVGALLLAPVGACSVDGEPESTPDRFTVRDSAGVTIATSRDSTWTAATRWRLSSEPNLVIGSVDGSTPGTDWSQIGDLLTVGNHIVVEATRLDEVRVFDARSGEYIRTLGGSGEGPTEFRLITRVDPIGDDRIAVVEGNTGKVVEFWLDGPAAPEIWSTGNPRIDDYFAGAVAGRTSDGDALLRYRPSPDLVDVGVETVDALWRRVARDGSLVRELPALPSQTFWKNSEYSLGIVQPLPRTDWRVVGDRLWHAYPETWELTAVNLASGSVERIVRRDLAPQVTPQSLIDARARFLREQAEDAPDEIRATIRRLAEDQVWAETLPAFRRFLVSPDGFIWVNAEPDPEIAVAAADPIVAMTWDSPYWTVLDPDGRWLGTVEVPEGFELWEVGVDHVLGVRKDELGVPFIERFGIVRGP